VSDGKKPPGPKLPSTGRGGRAGDTGQTPPQPCVWPVSCEPLASEVLPRDAAAWRKIAKLLDELGRALRKVERAEVLAR
jgi:hypothetical protein